MPFVRISKQIINIGGRKPRKEIEDCQKSESKNHFKKEATLMFIYSIQFK